MAAIKNTLYPKISGKPKNLLGAFAKYQRFSKTRRVSSISLTGTVKLHGTHGDIRIEADNTIHLQTRNMDDLTPALDNYRFLDFIQLAKAEIIELKKQIHARFLKLNPKSKIYDGHPLIIAGEWIGPKIQKDVAVSAFPERYFVIISISINNEWQPDELYSDIENESVYIVNVSRGGFYHETVQLSNPEPAFAKMQALADSVEKECPFAKTFGIIGLGEGIVWKPAAPLCHDAKYWLKLKGPISMGTAAAGPVRRAQGTGFLTPVFPVGRGPISPIQLRPANNKTISPGGFLATEFPASTPTVARSTVSRMQPARPAGNTAHQGGSLVTEFPPLIPSPAPSAVSHTQSGEMMSPQYTDFRRPLSESTPTAWVAKNATIVYPQNVKSNHSTAPTESGSGKPNTAMSEDSKPTQDSRPTSTLKKDEHRSEECLINLKDETPTPLKAEKIEGVAPENPKLIQSNKPMRLTPEMIQQARSEILSLIQSNLPETFPPVAKKADEEKLESESKRIEIPSPLTSPNINQSSPANAGDDHCGWPMPSFPKKVGKTKLGIESSSPPQPVPKIVKPMETASTTLSLLPSISEEAENASPETTKPTYPPLDLKKGEKPGVAAARNFAQEVVWERRLEQGWQYLIETGVRTDAKGAEAFLQWLWNDVEVEEEIEIEELDINKALLKKEIFGIGRNWYFEKLAFKEHNDNFGTGA